MTTRQGHAPRGEDTGAEPLFDLVVPTIGRPSLRLLLQAVDAGTGPLPGQIFLVDDRKHPSDPLPLPPLSRTLASRIRCLRSMGRGPAAARNAGWQAATAPWVAFLDDDIVPERDWLERLAEDLLRQPAQVAGSQGQVHVPLEHNRRPTDWERNVRLLERALWSTADMAYRREVLQQVGGFDERFRRAYREDSDLGIRVTRAGYAIRWGLRRVSHPVAPAHPFVSVRLQAGNADDVLMRALHGAWQTEPRRWGRRPRHLLVTGAAVTALAALTFGRTVPAAFAGAIWFAGTAEFALARILPASRDRKDILAMAVTSIAIPPAASAWWIIGVMRTRKLLADADRAIGHAATGARPDRSEATG